MFIEIDHDPNNPDMPNKHHISLDQIQEAVIFGPIFNTHQYMDCTATGNLDHSLI